MIVKTLLAHSIPRGPLIVSELKMAKLNDGDKVHAEPDLADRLLARYPNNLKATGHAERQMPANTLWQVEGAAPAPKAAAPTSGAPSALPEAATDRSMAGKGKARSKAPDAPAT